MLHGSCVSRDILDFDKEESIKLVSYSARSSLATLGSENVSKSIPDHYYNALNNIDSNFQRRMVASDFSNKFIQSIANNNCELLLIDLIDERFHLAKIKNKSVTRSSEFLKSGIKPDRLIDTYSEEYLEEWYKGVDHLFSKIDEIFGLDFIRINKVYWATVATESIDTDKLVANNATEKNNDKLDLMYKYIERNLPSKCIIDIPKSLLVADSSHKWGLAPFHYIDDYYETVLNILKS